MANPQTALLPGEDIPENQLLATMLGVASTQLIGLAAQLTIADLLSNGPKSIVVLAKTTGAREQALLQVLGALVALGIFTEVQPGVFANTPHGNCYEPTCQTRCETMPSCWQAA